MKGGGGERAKPRDRWRKGDIYIYIYIEREREREREVRKSEKEKRNGREKENISKNIALGFRVKQKHGSAHCLGLSDSPNRGSNRP